ncbi:MAG: diacylglycerol kinase family protein [Huintestinicola sp.]|uniref:diacylglycerol kinase family protein n=1 Tax=Huintestinicola sp. TaxID=2981661 RepID=UPI003F0C307D
MKSELKAFCRAFTYAFAGIVHGIKRERNIRFHLCAAVTVLAFMRFYRLTATEKCVIFLCIGGVISAELINTAVENAVDMYSKEKSPAAKAAKDCAAGAVLVMSLCAAVCGFAVFWNTAVFAEIKEYFACRPIAVIGAAVWAVLAFLFIFGIRSKSK